MEKVDLKKHNVFTFGMIGQHGSSALIDPIVIMYKKDGYGLAFDSIYYFNNEKKFENIILKRKEDSTDGFLVSCTINLDLLPQHIKKISLYVASTSPSGNEKTLSLIKDIRLFNSNLSNKEIIIKKYASSLKDLETGSGFVIGDLEKKQQLENESDLLWSFNENYMQIITEYTVYSRVINESNCIFL